MKKIFLILFALIGFSYANAQTATEYTMYRWTVDEYGEMSPKTDKAAECYSRLEFDFENGTIKVFTKSFGNTTIYFDSYESKQLENSDYYTKSIIRFDKKDEVVGIATFDNSDNMVSFIIIRGNRKIVYGKGIF